MATNCTIAPFINQGFYLTGTWGEQRATHKHAGVDLSTGGKANVYNMFKGTCIFVDHTGTTGSGYGPYIIIQEDNGRTWLYGDLEKFSNYKVGDVIEQFALISTEGNPSGTSSTGLHVHVELEMLSKGQAFKYGYNNSSNPCPIMGFPNSKNGVQYIFNGEIPKPEPEPEPEIKTKRKRKGFPWVLYARKLRGE